MLVLADPPRPSPRRVLDRASSGAFTPGMRAPVVGVGVVAAAVLVGVCAAVAAAGEDAAPSVNAKPVSLRVSMALRWSTCAAALPARGERCESGSASIVFRSRAAEEVYIRLPRKRKVPEGARGWHFSSGSGTMTCTRDRADLPRSDPKARRKGMFSVTHMDMDAWPAGGSSRVAVGVVPFPFDAARQSGDRMFCPLIFGASPESGGRWSGPPAATIAASALARPRTLTSTGTRTYSSHVPPEAKGNDDQVIGTRLTTTVRSRSTVRFVPG
jgi:hypothetical protein